MAGDRNQRPGNASKPNPLILAGLGLELAASVTILAWLGHWLDARWNTEPWLMIAGVAVALTGSFVNMWRLGRRFFE